MYFYGILLSLAILMSFGAGFLSLKIPQAPLSQSSPQVQIESLKQRFQTTKSEILKVNPLSIYTLSEMSELLDPETILPRTFDKDLDDIRMLHQFSSSCSIGLLNQLKKKKLDQDLKKEFLWSEFQCDFINKLPDNFFNSQPYTSIFGGSYVFKAIKNHNKFSLESKWIYAHLNFIHTLELSELRKEKIILPIEYENLAKLDEAALMGIFKKESFILGNQFVLLQEKFARSQLSESTRPEEFSSSYKVYALSDWQELVADSPIMVVRNQQNEICLLQEGSLCWIANQNIIYQPYRRQSFILFIVSLSIVFISILVILKKIKTHRREEERKRFALQTLTHELRTPIASLMVTMENLLNIYDQIPSQMQNQILKIANDVQRLKRLAEISRQYLNLDSKQMMKFHLQKIESLNHFTQVVLEPYKDQITFEPLIADQPCHLDPYWVGLCLKNLVENALVHGKKPITVSLKSNTQENKIEFQVQDSGIISSENSYKNNSAANFAKTEAKSKTFDNSTMDLQQGMGLGLSIVQKVITEMGGEFIQHSQPTLFGFRIGVK